MKLFGVSCRNPDFLSVGLCLGMVVVAGGATEQSSSNRDNPFHHTELLLASRLLPSSEVLRQDPNINHTSEPGRKFPMWNRSRPEWVLPLGRRFTHRAPEEGESIKNKSVDVIYGATLQSRAQRFRCVSKHVESLLKQTLSARFQNSS